MREKTTLEKILDKVYLEGGYTTGKMPNNGYIVGVGNVYTGDMPSKPSDIEELGRKLPKDSRLGFWLNENTLYIDKVEYVASRKDALLLAEKNHELAIWDITNKEEIWL